MLNLLIFIKNPNPPLNKDLRIYFKNRFNRTIINLIKNHKFRANRFKKKINKNLKSMEIHLMFLKIMLKL